MRPEVEKSGLLSARMDEERLDGEQLVEGRRPADIFLPSWDLGGNAALDFAVTSGLKTDMLQASSLTGISAATSYETKKREYLRTADCLREEGVQFIPMVVEAHSGSWGVAANKFWKKLARSGALEEGHDERESRFRMMQSMSIITHRENARAILRKSDPTSSFDEDFLAKMSP